MYDVLQTFGELTEEAIQNRKYAKRKAAYIHNCLQNGVTPSPGPMEGGEEGEGGEFEDNEAGGGPTTPAHTFDAFPKKPIFINGVAEKNHHFDVIAETT